MHDVIEAAPVQSPHPEESEMCKLFHHIRKNLEDLREARSLCELGESEIRRVQAAVKTLSAASIETAASQETDHNGEKLLTPGAGPESPSASGPSLQLCQELRDLGEYYVNDCHYLSSISPFPVADRCHSYIRSHRMILRTLRHAWPTLCLTGMIV